MLIFSVVWIYGQLVILIFLVIDGPTIQARLSFQVKPNHSQLFHTFSHHNFSGKVKASLHLLSDPATTVKPLSLDAVLLSGKSVFKKNIQLTIRLLQRLFCLLVLSHSILQPLKKLVQF